MKTNLFCQPKRRRLVGIVASLMLLATACSVSATDVTQPVAVNGSSSATAPGDSDTVAAPNPTGTETETDGSTTTAGTGVTLANPDAEDGVETGGEAVATDATDSEAAVASATELGETSFEILEALHEEQGDTLEVDLAAFSAVWGPISGAPTLPIDGSLDPITEGHTMTAMLERWDELSEQQREEIEVILFELFENAEVIENVGVTDETGGGGSTSLAVEDESLADAQAIIDDVLPRLTALLGWELSLPINLGGGLTSGPWAESSSVFTILGIDFELTPPGLEFDKCQILVAGNFHTLSASAQISAIAHEVFHCFQYDMLGRTTSALNALPEWITEGTAAWVGEQMAGGSTLLSESWWSTYHVTPYPLFGASYAAIGYWDYVDKNSSGLFGLLRRILESRPTNESGLTLTSDLMTGEDSFGAWAASKAERPDWGPDWTTNGASGAPAGLSTIPPSIRINAELDEAIERGAGPGEARLWEFVPQVGGGEPGIFTITTSGLGRLRWEPAGETMSFDGTTTNWCVNGPCECPDGSAPTDIIVSDPPAGASSMIVAASGAVDGLSTATGSVTPLTDYCEDSEPTPVPESEEPAPLDGIDTCLVGRWIADTSSFFGAALALPGSTTVTGEAWVDYRADGTGSNQFDALTITNNDPETGVTTTIVANASGTFSWGTGGGRFTGNSDDFVFATEATLSVGGVEIPLEIEDFFEFDFPDTTGIADYTCNDSTLTFTPDEPTAFFTMLTRVG